MKSQQFNTNNAIHESVAFRENSTVLIWKNQLNLSYASHWHTAMEIIIPIENSYDVSVCSQDFHLLPKEILIIPPGEIHSLHAPDCGLRYIYLIDISFLNNIRNFISIQALMAQPVSITRQNYPKIYEDILDMFFEIKQIYFEDNEYSELTIYSILLKIFAELGYQRTNNQELFSHTRIDKKKEYIQKLNTVLDFIDSNYAEDLKLESLAAMTGFSQYHFSRLFTEYTGHSFCDYVNLRRIKATESFLSDENLSITETAMLSGFSSIATFNRVFKKFKGCSPSEFRTLNKHL